MATLMAQHALEKAIAFNQARQGALPPMTEEEPLVQAPDSPRQVSWYFNDLAGFLPGIEETDQPELYWAMKPFTCEVKNYFIDQRLYKIIAYVSYDEGGRKNRLFLERLVSGNNAEALASGVETP